LLRTVSVDLPVYPGKGYSATFALRRPTLRQHHRRRVKCAISRLDGWVAGTIEVGGYDLSLDAPLARARCGCWPGGSSRCARRATPRLWKDGAPVLVRPAPATPWNILLSRITVGRRGG
jgi:hypothetical protein